MVEPPRLTVLRALGLGDLLAAVPALRAIARAFPDHQRLLLAPPALSPLLPLIVEEGSLCLHGLVACPGLGADHCDLPARPEVAVNLHGKGPQSHRLLLRTRPRRLLSFHHDEVLESIGMPHWDDDEHEVERWCRLLNATGIAADPAELAIRRPGTPPPAVAHGATVIHPGAASAARRWPAERWAMVARAEREAGRTVLITGSLAEAPLAQRIIALAGLLPGAALAGRTDLLELAAVVAVAGRVACGDTGVGHLATALAVPSILLFGPTSPATWGPPNSGRHRVLWAGTTGDPHAERVDDGLLAIEPAAVIEALNELGTVAPA
jgi:ADP-heptose:LPS heptosyltransferase